MNRCNTVIFCTLLILSLVLTGCTSSKVGDKEIITHKYEQGEFYEWKTKLITETGENSLISKELKNCEDARVEMIEKCMMSPGWMVDTMMTITQEGYIPYELEEIEATGGCTEDEDKGIMISSKSFDATSGQYELICTVGCYTWECEENKEDDYDLDDDDDGYLGDDYDDVPKTKQASLDATNLACPDIPGFMHGDVYSPGFSNDRTYAAPTLLNAYGREGSIFCKYYRDSGEREWGGDVIYEGASISAHLQVDGSFDARPDWATENYCKGGENSRGSHIDLYSDSHVVKITYVTTTEYSADIRKIMQEAAKKWMNELEKGYAITCS